MKGQRLHQTLATFTGMSLIQLFAVLPGKTLPALGPVASHRIAHRSHAANVKIIAFWSEDHGENTAQIMMALDNAPACQVGCRPLGNQFAAGNFPDANFTHQVAGGNVSAIGGKSHRLHWWNVTELLPPLAGFRIEDFDRRLALRSRLVFVAARFITPGDGRDQ